MGCKDSKLLNVQIKDSAWGSAAWCSGALNLANLERVELDRVFIDEGNGYGVKALGTQGQMHFLKVHDCRFSVTPVGKWLQPNGAAAPNIAFELFNVDMRGIEFYNNYIDNTLSLIMDAPHWTPTGIQTIRIYNNVFDMGARANGGSYSIEASLHDIEIDHNYILKGKWGIVNWDKDGPK